MFSQEAPGISAGAHAFIGPCSDCGRKEGQECTKTSQRPAEVEHWPARVGNCEIYVLRRMLHLCWCCSPGCTRGRRPRNPPEASRPAAPPTSGGRPSQRRCPGPPLAAAAAPRPGGISGRPQAARPPMPRSCRMCTGLQGNPSAEEDLGWHEVKAALGAAISAAVGGRSGISVLQINYLLHMGAPSFSCRGSWVAPFSCLDHRD